MADYPALPLWTDAYLADTRHLTTLEHGAYLLLLQEAWRRPTCSLPDNDDLLARLAGLSIDGWFDVKNTVMAFWDHDGRRKEWTQKRLLKERAYVASKSRSQSDNSLKRWRPKKNRHAMGMPTGIPNACQTDAPTPTPLVSKEQTSKQRSDAGASSVPVVASPDDLKALLFGPALGYLTAHSGYAERSVRGMIGRWIKDHGEAGTLMAISAAQRNGAIEAVAYTTGALNNGKLTSKDNSWITDWYTAEWSTNDDDDDTRPSEGPGGKAPRVLFE